LDEIKQRSIQRPDLLGNAGDATGFFLVAFNSDEGQYGSITHSPHKGIRALQTRLP
jgi:hypothetical protein